MIKRMIAAGIIALLPNFASAAAVIADGNVRLGVLDLGNLNYAGVGVQYVDPNTGTSYESTSYGCACEGWGLAVDGTPGFANASTGTAGLTLVSFTSTAESAVSVVTINGTDVRVTHDYHLSASEDLMEVTVTIENTGTTAIADLEYRRVMDWDTAPTPFNEYVSIGGTTSTTLLLGSSDQGFSSANPLTDFSGATYCPANVDFTACGPKDHGSVFDFGLGGLGAGETYSFSIYYGGSAGLTAANTALGTVGAELYSYGWSGSDADQDGVVDGSTGVAPTFIFAFSGVGGTAVVPNPTASEVPLPAGGVLLLTGLAGFGLLRRRKAQA